MRGSRYVVFFSCQLRTRRLKFFYYDLSEKEKSLDILRGKMFGSLSDMARTVEDELKGLDSPVDVKYDWKEKKFPYKLRHKAIQRKTHRFGHTILFTNANISAGELLMTHREKDAVKKRSHTSNPTWSHPSLGRRRERGLRSSHPWINICGLHCI
ncbi:MAG: hypothetical protein QW292_13160 [Candidatus Parvarchaeota archaeon]